MRVWLLYILQVGIHDVQCLVSSCYSAGWHVWLHDIQLRYPWHIQWVRLNSLTTRYHDNTNSVSWFLWHTFLPRFSIRLTDQNDHWTFDLILIIIDLEPRPLAQLFGFTKITFSRQPTVYIKDTSPNWWLKFMEWG